MGGPFKKWFGEHRSTVHLKFTGASEKDQRWCGMRVDDERQRVRPKLNAGAKVD